MIKLIKKIEQWIENIFLKVVRKFYQSFIDATLKAEIQNMDFYLISKPELIKVKKGKRKYYLFNYIAKGKECVIWISRHENFEDKIIERIEL